MPDSIGVAVHYQKSILATSHDQMRSVIAGPRRFAQKIVRARFRKVFETPGRPKRFQLDFWEIHLVSKVKNRKRKSSLSPAPQSAATPKRPSGPLDLSSHFFRTARNSHRRSSAMIASAALALASPKPSFFATE